MDVDMEKIYNYNLWRSNLNQLLPACGIWSTVELLNGPTATVWAAMENL